MTGRRQAFWPIALAAMIFHPAPRQVPTVVALTAQPPVVISRADLSTQSVTTLREIANIRNVRNLMRGTLIFGTVLSLLSTSGQEVAALLNTRDLDTNARAVDAIGAIAACRLVTTVSLRILDATGPSASAPWKTAVEARYFDELLRQSNAACKR